MLQISHSRNNNIDRQEGECGKALHIVPYEKFHRIGGAPPKTFPNFKYDAPEGKCFDSPIRK